MNNLTITRQQAQQHITERLEAIQQDGTGATAERVSGELMDQMTSEDADWLYDSWEKLIQQQNKQ